MDRAVCLQRLLLAVVLSTSAQHYITSAVSLPITTGSSGSVDEVLAGKIHPDTAVSNAQIETNGASAESAEGSNTFELVRRRTNFRGDLGKRIGGNGGRRNAAYNPFSTGRLRPDLGKRTASAEMAEASWPWRRIQRGSDALSFEQRPSSRRRLRPDLGKRSGEIDDSQLGELRSYLWRPILSDLPTDTGLYVDDMRPRDVNDEERFDANEEDNSDVDDDVLEQAVLMMQRRALAAAASRSGTRANQFRGDLGKRRPASNFRGDLGKRSDESIFYRRRRRSTDSVNDVDEFQNTSVEDDDLMTTDNDKRSGRSGNENARKSFRGDLGKRRNSFRGDLGKRSRGAGTSAGGFSTGSMTYEDSISALNGEEVKRKSSKSFRGDLGKRFSSEDGSSPAAEDSDFMTSSSTSFAKRPRQQFRGDLGKRASATIEAREELNLPQNESD